MNKEQKNIMTEEVGKLCIDIAKLIVGGVILAEIMRTDIAPERLIIFGSAFVFLFAIFGIIFIIKSKNK